MADVPPPEVPLAAEPPAAPAAPAAPVEPHPPLRVVHQEETFVAVSKPGGLLVHRDDHHPNAPAALQVVRDQLGKYLYPFHRLDRATSGLLLFGFSREAAAALQASLSAEDAHKDYVALLRWPGSNRELPDTWLCDRPLHDEKDVAREARTEFTLLEKFRHCALVRCRIFTGRYHQIRRHANHSGRHVLGDTTHGKGRINAAFREKYGLPRLFLHLERISMRHPSGGTHLELFDPLPMDLATVLEQLRAEALRPEPAEPTVEPPADLPPACPPSPS